VQRYCIKTEPETHFPYVAHRYSSLSATSCTKVLIPTSTRTSLYRPHRSTRARRWLSGLQVVGSHPYAVVAPRQKTFDLWCDWLLSCWWERKTRKRRRTRRRARRRRRRIQWRSIYEKSEDSAEDSGREDVDEKEEARIWVMDILVLWGSGGSDYLRDFVQERKVYEAVSSLGQVIKRRPKVAVVVERKNESMFISDGAGFCESRTRHSFEVVTESFVLCKIDVSSYFSFWKV